MKIRSITYFFAPAFSLDAKQFEEAKNFASLASATFQESEYEVQTIRIATTPFGTYLPIKDETAAITLIKALEEHAKNAGFDYLAIGPATPTQPDSYKLIPSILSATEITFTSGLITLNDHTLSTASALACAEIIKDAATLSPDGFANLRFATLANVSSGVPFFPAAYHLGDEPQFALAMEAADLVNSSLTGSHSLKEARRNMIASFEKHGAELSQIAEEIAKHTQVKFAGIDFTPAPFPSEGASFGDAIERLGISKIGYHGSLAAAAFLTDTLDRAKFPRAGFNGLFMPLLEDAVLAKRAKEGVLSIKDLLLYSTVCGTGLDTIPIPGDTSVDELYAILLDIGSLSCRLDKPLTARLMPIPGKNAGELTEFDFPYFANSCILGIHAEKVTGLLQNPENLQIKPRKIQK